MILSGSFTAASCLIIFALMFLHATHLSKSNEQIKILRISLIIPFWSIFSFLSVCFPTAEVYLHPWLEFVQAICLGTFFLLLCEFVSPSAQHRDVFFAALTVKNKKAANGEENGLEWFRKMWFAVFQYPVVTLLVAIVTAITQAAGVYCEFASKTHFAKLWVSIRSHGSILRGSGAALTEPKLSIISNVSLTVAIVAVLRFFMQLKPHLSEHRPISKFAAFKLVVTLTFLENMLPLAAFFHYAYSYRPYVIGSGRASRPLAGDHEAYAPRTYSGGPGGLWALIELWNPMEIVEAVAFGLRMKAEERKQQRAQKGWQSVQYQQVQEDYEMGRR
ncbi:hypothetical protein CSUB01_07457 [Colletotrichum sublineola]|uniref:Uncharacterized protein n=1 Tax=Colletotrichum sublineola TaxID=1173701 RepID=A0A066XBP5_COLSU|nr:hypothetical protein CSUB01_07457 [Colletotrichum sublineola]